MKQDALDTAPARLRGERIVAGLLGEKERLICADVLSRAREGKVLVAIGGGIACSAYSGFLRATKDLDLFVLPEDAEKLLKILARAGFEE
ncbi:MAG: hypothetical protein C4519_12230, partial [Desulfobacteraceae bacterium]